MPPQIHDPHFYSHVRISGLLAERLSELSLGLLNVFALEEESGQLMADLEIPGLGAEDRSQFPLRLFPTALDQIEPGKVFMGLREILQSDRLLELPQGLFPPTFARRYPAHVGPGGSARWIEPYSLPELLLGLDLLVAHG